DSLGKCPVGHAGFERRKFDVAVNSTVSLEIQPGKKDKANHTEIPLPKVCDRHVRLNNPWCECVCSMYDRDLSGTAHSLQSRSLSLSISSSSSTPMAVSMSSLTLLLISSTRFSFTRQVRSSISAMIYLWPFSLSIFRTIAICGGSHWSRAPF